MLQSADQRNQYLTRGLYTITIKIESISQLRLLSKDVTVLGHPQQTV